MASLASLMRNQTPEARGGLAHGLHAHIERFSRSLAGTFGYGQFRHSDLSQKGRSSGDSQLNTLKSTGAGCRFLEICSQIDFLEMA